MRDSPAGKKYSETLEKQNGMKKIFSAGKT